MPHRTRSRWLPWQERLTNGWIEAGGCWIWQRSRNSRGYGVIYFDGRLHLAHRAAWLLAHGEWPDPAKVLDHLCNTKACVNPDHLREVTNSQNLRRAIPRGSDEVEAKRAGWRRTNAKRRGTYRYTDDGGE